MILQPQCLQQVEYHLPLQMVVRFQHVLERLFLVLEILKLLLGYIIPDQFQQECLSLPHNPQESKEHLGLLHLTFEEVVHPGLVPYLLEASRPQLILQQVESDLYIPLLPEMIHHGDLGFRFLETFIHGKFLLQLVEVLHHVDLILLQLVEVIHHVDLTLLQPLQSILLQSLESLNLHR